MTIVMPQAVACSRLAADRDHLLAADQAARDGAEIEVRCGQLSPDLATVSDVFAHVTMWDEIVLGLLLEALHGRCHWSLDKLYTTPEVGRALNAGSVRASRQLPQELVRRRFASARAVLIETLAAVPPERWDAPLTIHRDQLQPRTLAGLLQYANTPEGDPARVKPYLHATAHLVMSADVSDEGTGVST